MATKQTNVSEKRKHSPTTSVQRREKTQKIPKTVSTVKENTTNVTTNRQKSAVFYSVSIVCLGRSEGLYVNYMKLNV
jgi:hypothetical protein